MSAGTVGFTDTRKDTNHIGRVISRIIEARKLAEEERAYAESIANRYQTSLEEAGIERGYFFKKALRWKFGGEFKQKKLAQVSTWKTRGGLLKTALTGKSGKNKLSKFERSQAIFDMFKANDKPKTFRDKFRPLYEGFVDDPMLRPMSHWVKPGTAKKIQKATTRKKRVSKEDILDSLGAVTESIQKIAESISEKNKVVADQMIHSSVLQGMMHEQLKSNADSLDNKLQKIINALSNQTEFEKETLKKAENRRAENKLERQKDVASIVNFDNLLTKEDESKISATSAQDVEFQQMAAYEQPDIPKAESGAIFSGPDSGYLAELHGDEVVVPINNNYTQGEPSAVDGKVRPKPNGKVRPKPKQSIIPKYETGTSVGTSSQNKDTSPITAKFGFNATKNIIGVGGGGTTESTKLTQSMMDVMSLPMMATGGSLLAATSMYMQRMAGEGVNIAPEIEKVARPIASVFGLPSSLTRVAKKSTQKKGAGREEETGESKKNIISKLIDGFGELMKKLSEGVNRPTPPPGPGNGEEIDYSNLQAGDVSSTAGKVATLYDEMRDLGFTPEASKRLISEIGREGGMQNANLFGTHTDPAAGIPNTGMISWNQTRRDKLIAEAKKAGVWDESKGQFKVSAEALRFQVRFLRNEMATGNADMQETLRLLTDTGANPAEISRRLRDDVIIYRTDAGYSGGPDPEYGSVRNKEWYNRLKLNEDLERTRQQSTTPPSSQPVQLGQAITNNYGLGLHQERTFIHPQYGEIKAHKTDKGFDFYGPGFKNRLDMSPSNPQAKSIVDYFTSTNGGQQIAPPSSSRTQREQDVSSISRPSGGRSSGGGLTILNTGGGQQVASAGSSPYPSGDTSGAESGENPTQNFYSNPFSIGVG